VDVIELINAAPNLAFGIICLWFLYQIHKERVSENARYALSLEKINELYIQLLEKAVTAIANNANQSQNNGEVITKLLAECAAIRQEIGGLRDSFTKFVRDSARRDKPNSRDSSSGAGTD
jgi:hypothetical protein